MRGYPVLITDNRVFDQPYTGEVCVCDIDGTYLATDMTSLRKALAIPFQFAVDKVTIPGAVSLLRELRHGPDERSSLVPLYFVSASPPQMRRVLERRMLLDGVEFDGIAFKDQLKLARRGRFNELKHQTGYKLSALLEYRKRLPPGTRWRLFGDDIEADAEIYTLFAEICGGKRGEALVDSAVAKGADKDVAVALAETAESLPPGNPVQGIYIHQTKGRELTSFPAGVTVSSNYLQTALCLRAAGRIGPLAISRVSEELSSRGLGDKLPASIEDARLRLGIPAAICDEAKPVAA